MPHATFDDIVDYMDDPEIGPELRVTVRLETAADVISGLAPPPEAPDADTDADYRRRARNGELQLFEWLWTTRAGMISSESSVVGTSVSYVANNPTVQAIVASAMGDFYAGGDVGGVDRAYVGRLKPPRSL